jgi:hypothetical protein
MPNIDKQSMFLQRRIMQRSAKTSINSRTEFLPLRNFSCSELRLAASASSRY